MVVLTLEADGSVGMDEAALAFWARAAAPAAATELFDGPIAGEATALLGDGRRVPVRIEVVPGDPVTLAVEDNREAIAARERVERSESQLREAQAIGGIGSWHWDVASNQTTWSDELYRIFGQDPATYDATYEGWMACIHPDDVALTQEATGRSFQTGEPFRFDHRVVRPDGDVRYLHCQGAVVMGPEGPLHAYGTSQDITEAREAERNKQRLLDQELELAHLEELNEARTSLLHTLAHELNTPLTPIRLQMRLLTGGHMGALPDRALHALEVIERNIARLGVLTGDMLDVARLEDGHLELRPRPMDLMQLARSAIDTFRAEATDQGITIVLQGVPVTAQVDPDRLTQVMFNLVSNAIKFSDPGDTVHIRVEGDQEAVIYVEDEGVGIDAEGQTRLFRPFSRVTTDPNRPGNGLGLHICKGIVEQHGGSLRCTSAGPGKGTTFSVHLPVAPPLAADLTATRDV